MDLLFYNKIKGRGKESVQKKCEGATGVKLWVEWIIKGVSKSGEGDTNQRRGLPLFFQRRHWIHRGLIIMGLQR